jgi:hypothetical protein
LVELFHVLNQGSDSGLLVFIDFAEAFSWHRVDIKLELDEIISKNPGKERFGNPFAVVFWIISIKTDKKPGNQNGFNLLFIVGELELVFLFDIIVSNEISSDEILFALNLCEASCWYLFIVFLVFEESFIRGFVIIK